MPDAQDSTFTNRDLVAKITAAYLRRNKLRSDELASLISTIHETVVRLGKPAAADDPRTPAVPIRRSVGRDHVVCLECGWRGKMLRRHLTVAHGLNTDEYRGRWHLSAAHPLTAPEYRERRVGIAKLTGLGRNRAVAGAGAAHNVTHDPAGGEPTA
jgi:predicted transcriptional regulator